MLAVFLRQREVEIESVMGYLVCVMHWAESITLQILAEFLRSISCDALVKIFIKQEPMHLKLHH